MFEIPAFISKARGAAWLGKIGNPGVRIVYWGVNVWERIEQSYMIVIIRGPIELCEVGSMGMLWSGFEKTVELKLKTPEYNKRMI